MYSYTSGRILVPDTRVKLLARILRVKPEELRKMSDEARSTHEQIKAAKEQLRKTA